jgi:peptidoglycan/LPS O-acetylase OafA/YrhL
MFREAPTMIVEYIWLLIALAVLCLVAAYVIWYLWNAHLAYRGERQRRAAARAAARLAVVDARTAYTMLDRKPGVRRDR